MFLKIRGVEQEKSLKVRNAAKSLKNLIQDGLKVFGDWRHVYGWVL